MTSAIPEDISALKSIPHSPLVFPPLPALATAATESVNVRLFYTSAAWLWSCVRKGYYKDRNNYYKENKVPVSSKLFCGRLLIKWQKETFFFFHRNGEKDKAFGLLIWDRAGWRTGKLGVESNEPSAEIKLYILVERGRVSDPSQKVKLRRGRDDMEEKAESLALFFKTTCSFPGRVPLMREVLCSESPIQGKSPQAGGKSSSALEQN